MADLTRGRRRLVLAICCMSLLIVGLDVTIVNVALPSIQADLHASVAGLQWTLDAYTLVIASLLILSGSTADRIGRRRIFQTGLVVFTAGSLLCSLAPTLPWLVTFRVVQAVGGSMLNPVAMSIITNVFTAPRERAQAIGVWSGVIGISMSLGPIVGGALVDGVGWRSIFWINVPVGVVAFLLAARFVPESRAARPRRVDPVGQVLVFVALATLVYAIIEGPGRGFGSPLIVGLFVVSGASVVAFVLYENRRPEPLIDPRFFRSLPFSSATVIAVCAFAALAGFLFLSTLYLQRVRGLSPLHAGLATLPYALTALIFAPLSGRIVGARGTRLPLAVAGVTLTVSGLLLLPVDATTPYGWLLAAYSLFGIGFGMVNAPITNTAVSGMPTAQAGVAAAIASTSRQVGAALGIAVIGSVVSASDHGQVGAGFIAASRAGWVIITGCGLVVLVLGFASSGRRAKASATAVTERLAADAVTG